MSKITVFGALSVALIGLFAWTALGAVDVTIANNSQVESRLLKPDGVHRYRMFLPAGAKLSASVKGKKDKKAGTAAPTMRLRFLDDFEDELIQSEFLDKAKQKDKGTGSKAKATIEDSGEYIVEVFSLDGSIGAYTVSAKWGSPKKGKIKDEFFFGGDETDVEIAVDEDAELSLKVKGKGGSAQPFFDRIEGDEFDQELDDSSKVKGITVLEGGDLFVVIGNTSGEGKIVGSVKIKPPKTKKTKLTITPVKNGTEDKAIIGKVAVPSKDVLVEADDEDIVGEEIVGASVLIPAGAVSQPTSIQIGTADPLLPPTPEDGVGAGPTVFFGPSGTQFQSPVTVTIPIDPDVVDEGNVEDLAVFTEDEDGNVEEIDDFDVDLDDESVSFQASHFSTFRAFLRGVVAGKLDLDGDGVDDLVLPAPQAANGSGRVYVFSGVPEDGVDTSEADYTISGNTEFGSAFARGDVNGDGQADLVVIESGTSDGKCYVFFGGVAFPGVPGFSDVVISGASGFGGMNSVAVGDVNDDGVGDILIGGEDGPTGEGAVVVFFGREQWQQESTSSADLTFTGEQTGDLFGAAVAGGDVNADGIDDLIVGADMIDNPGRAGACYIQLGGTSIQSADAPQMDVVIGGSAPDSGFGLNIVVGDVTGDGNGDLLVSEFDDDLGGPGAVFLFHGRSAITSVTSTSGATWAAVGTDDEVVGSSLALADVDGNDVLDLIIGARGAAQGDGGFYVVDGGSQLLTALNLVVSTPVVSGPGFFEGFPVFGPAIRAGSNSALVAFAPGNEDGDIGAGAAYLFFGDPRDLGTGATTDDADVTIFGQEDDSLGGDLF